MRKLPQLKKYLLLLLVALIYSAATGQIDGAEKKKLDALKLNLLEANSDSSSCEALYNLGKFQFFELRKLSEATKNLYRALEIAELKGFALQQAQCNDAIAWIEDRKGNYFAAFKYMEKACAYYATLDNPYYTFKSYYNLGSMAEGAQKFDLAKECLENATLYARSADNKDWILNALNALGHVYYSENSFSKALEVLLEAAQIKFEKYGNYGNGRIPYSISNSFAELGQLKQANYWMEIAIQCATRENDLLFFKEVYYENFLLQQRQGKAVDALESFKLYTKYKDSLFNTDALIAALDAEESYLQKLDSARQMKVTLEQQLDKANIKKKESERNVVILILVLATAIGASVFMFYRTKKKAAEKRLILVTNNQNKLSLAYDKLEEANIEILDSINCAKRIQSAILPPSKLIEKLLPNSFILYKPKAIVAGDFYWIEQVGEKVLFAVCDCTGHGVPGALISIICNNALNKAVREHKLIDPGMILNKTREIVIAEFEKSDEEVKDGMDMALCSIEGGTLQYAGAINPLWIVRKDAKEVEEIKANRQPIGKIENLSPYTTHEFHLEPEDSIYIFSDGYADQFGGKNGKKFKLSNLKKLLLSMQREPLQRQKEMADETFEKWKGHVEQVDDVCLFGLRI